MVANKERVGTPEEVGIVEDGEAQEIIRRAMESARTRPDTPLDSGYGFEFDPPADTSGSEGADAGGVYEAPGGVV
ncbi:MAG TPA: hypothetical protein VFC50_00895 [Candidatus Dormibacteraeota bacterium]|nr:hypothetical protein [Candidatus Dormibacteraeota bacterium]